MNGAVMRAYTGTPSRWNEIVAQFPGAHLLQTMDWAQIKAAQGWQPMPFVWDARDAGHTELGVPPTPVAAAMVLRKQVSGRGLAARLCVMYVPKGPLWHWNEQPVPRGVFQDLEGLARSEEAIFVKIDPDVVLGRGIPGAPASHEDAVGREVVEELGRRRWVLSDEQIQFRNSVIIDLLPSEDQILARMKQKARYNIRLAAKKGVLVRPGTVDELPLLYRMYAETSARDGFVIRNQGYYERVWTTFMRSEARRESPGADCLVAVVDGEVAAGIFVFYFADRAYYLYGMSRAVHREKMPNYLLQWEAIRAAKGRGCRVYDLWGAPDQFEEKDPLWGVFRFKEGLGGEVVRTLGAWDFPARRLWYPAYARIVPRILDIMRWRSRSHVRQDLTGA
jgi:peptidoglycan pentaglycine glycine transferase (the first glycine)